MIEGVLFVICSLALRALSWRSLRAPRAHGFPRFFAFEAILALVLIQMRHWFARPLAPHQLVSWVLLLGSIPIGLQGSWLLVRAGKPAARAGRDTDLGFERTTVLVRTGVYRWIRHPLYASLLLLAWGAFFKRLTLAGGLLAAAASLLLAATARLEEAENREKFGSAYAEYARTTWRFVPFVY